MSSSRAKAEKSRKRSWENERAERPVDSDPSSYSTSIQLARYSVNTLGWLFVVFLAAFLAVQCDRYIALRRYEAPPPPQDELELALERVSDTYRVDEIIDQLESELSTVTGQLGGELGNLAPVTLVDGTGWPTDGVCLREGFGDADAGDWVQTSAPSTSASRFEFDGEHYHFRSTGHLAFARDVPIYAIDTGYDTAVQAQLHIVPGRIEYATVDVSAFYNDPGALGAFDACTYRADTTLNPALDDGNRPEAGYAPLKVDVFRLQHRDVNSAERAHASFNITLTIPDGKDRALYSLKIGNYNVTLHKGLTLDALGIETHGRVHAQNGFMATDLSVDTYGARGNVSGWFNVIDADVAIRTDGASIDARVELTRGPDQAGQTRVLDLQANDACVLTTV